MKLLANDTRNAVFYLNYKSDLKGISAYEPLGPNELGEHLWPVEVDGARLGLSLVPPEGLVVE